MTTIKSKIQTRGLFSLESNGRVPIASPNLAAEKKRLIAASTPIIISAFSILKFSFVYINKVFIRYYRCGRTRTYIYSSITDSGLEDRTGYTPKYTQVNRISIYTCRPIYILSFYIKLSSTF